MGWAGLGHKARQWPGSPDSYPLGIVWTVCVHGPGPWSPGKPGISKGQPKGQGRTPILEGNEVKEERHLRKDQSRSPTHNQGRR